MLVNERKQAPWHRIGMQMSSKAAQFATIGDWLGEIELKFRAKSVQVHAWKAAASLMSGLFQPQCVQLSPINQSGWNQHKPTEEFWPRAWEKKLIDWYIESLRALRFQPRLTFKTPRSRGLRRTSSTVSAWRASFSREEPSLTRK